jgi:hypothetical protein
MTRSAHRSTACTELAEQEVLDKIRQRRLEADLRRAAAGADRLDGNGPDPRRSSAAGSARAVAAVASAAVSARLRAIVGRHARPGSPTDR